MRFLSVTLLLTIMITPAPTTHADGTQPSPYSSDLPNPGDPLYLAQADSESAGEAARSEQCLAFSKDLDADLGEVLRAGCEPTLAQMSKLMDNPLGNVAMWFNQFDYYRMENSTFNEKKSRACTPVSSSFRKN